MRVADYITNFVYKKGINDVFLLPGGGAMYLVDAFGSHKNLNYVPCHHEQSCSIAAEAYARITENFGVALVTTGPGATNTITGVVAAWIESVPVMIISGQVKREDMIGGKKVRQGGVQEVDIINIIKEHTKYAATVLDSKEIKYHLERAYYEMMNGRKGPVWLDIPLDIQASLIEEEKLTSFRPSKLLNTIIDENKINKLIELINNSKRPLLLAGHGIRLSGATKLFRTVVEKIKIPVVATWNAMDIIEYDSPYFVGKPGVAALRPANFAIQNCDLLISIGSRLDSIITAYNPKNFAKNANKVLVDVDENEIKKHNDMRIELNFNSDVLPFLEHLNKKANDIDGTPNEWIKLCNKWKKKYTINYETTFNHNQISHLQFADILSDALKGGEIIVTGSSGLGIEAFYMAFRAKANQRVFLTSGFGSMGYGLPAAIGTSFANNKKPIIAIESDGSLQLNIQELATIKGNNLPICLFVLDNGGYASIRNTQKNYFNNRYVASSKESKLYMPNLEKICKAYDINCITIKTALELKENIKEIVTNINAPFVVIVKTIENETLFPKSIAIPQKNGSMISMPLEDMSPLLPIEELKENMLFELDEKSWEARNIIKQN